MTIREVLDQQLSSGDSRGLLALLEDIKSGAELYDLKTRAASWIDILNSESGVAPPPVSKPVKPASTPSPRPHSKKK